MAGARQTFGVWWRFVLGGLVAVAIAVALHWSLTAESTIAGGDPEGSVAAVPDAVMLPESFPRGRPWLLYVLGPDAVAPPRAAPVVAVPRGGGAVRIERGPFPPDRPDAAAAPWPAAAVRLPVARLDELDAVERAAVAEVLRAWRIVGQLPHGEWIERGVVASPAGRQRLLRWVR